MLPTVNCWIKGVWDDPEGPITYSVLYARQSYWPGIGKRRLARMLLNKCTRLTLERDSNEQFFIGYCHDQRLLYYDVCDYDGQWARHAADGESVLNVPQYSVDEEWIFLDNHAYNAALTVHPEAALMTRWLAKNTWEMLQPEAWREDTLASLKRTRDGIDATGYTFKLCKQFSMEIPEFGHWRSPVEINQELQNLDAVRDALASYHKILFDLERLGFGVDRFENRSSKHIQCTTVSECIEYLLDAAGCANEDYLHNNVHQINEEFKKRYRVTMSIEIAYGSESLAWMKNRKAARGDGQIAMGPMLSRLPSDVLDKIFAGLLLH